MSIEPLPVTRVADVAEEPGGVSWLIEGLWTEQGVGFLGGNPKSCKTWLSLDIALSVATQTKALGHHAATTSGPVLLFAAEDAPAMVRARLLGMAAQRGIALTEVPIHLVLTNRLCLEAVADQGRLSATIARLRPRLVVLDPFVRLTRIDENSALEVSAVLAYLREVQREHRTAILIVHHARKSSSNQAPTGLALRGSGDLWAWSDTNLYLSRRQDALHLSIEHRSAAPPEPISLELSCELPTGPYLRMSRVSAALEPPEPRNLTCRILDALATAAAPSRPDDLRAALRVRMQTLVDALRDLERQGQVHRAPSGWKLASDALLSRTGIVEES
jgi:hypothetical protein